MKSTHLKYMNILTNRQKHVKTAQIIISALSSGGIISIIFYNQLIVKWISAAISTLLLGINLYFKNFDLSDEIKKHRITADELWYIREDYVSLLTDFETMTDKEIITKRKDLQNRTYTVYRNSPKTNSKSYKQAQQALKYDEEQFFSVEEIDRILPEHLREKQ
nr:SLATT domain-containing protein [Weissella koreensis]